MPPFWDRDLRELYEARLNEEDNIQAIFEPDDDELEIRRDEGLIPVVEKAVEKERPEEDELELTVHKKKEEEGDEEFTGEGMDEYDPTLELSNYKFPTLELLEEHSSGNAEVSNEDATHCG